MKTPHIEQPIAGHSPGNRVPIDSQFTTAISAKITEKLRRALASQAAKRGTTESSLIREILEQFIEVSPDVQVLMEFQCISEEKTRQFMILAAQRKLDDPVALEEAEKTAIEKGLGVYRRRLHLIRGARGERSQAL